ncbi:MAG: cytidine deaminase [Opitutales bacterium]
MSTHTTEISPEVEAAWRVAIKARENAYTPYSGFKVGAAIRIKGSAAIIPGCNVENASYGATMCAERTAIFAACAQFGKPEIESIVIVTGEPTATVPCALCLQVMAEFCSPTTPIFSGNAQGISKVWLLRDLLPKPFVEFDTP